MQSYRCIILRPLGYPVLSNGCRMVSTKAQTVSSADLTADPELADAKPFSSIPGVTGIFKSLGLMKDFLPFLGKYGSGDISLPKIHMDLYREFGPISRLDLLKGNMFLVFLFDPNDIQKVFQHEGPNPRRNMMQALMEYRRGRPDLYSSAGILADNGTKWYHVRSKVQVPMLKPQIVETYLPKMTVVSEDFIKRILKLQDIQGEVPDFLNELYMWSLEAIGLVAFNTRLGCLSPLGLDENSEAQRVLNSTVATFEALLLLEMKLHWRSIFPRKSKMKLDAAQAYLLSVASKYCNVTLNNMKTSPNGDFGILGELLRRNDLDVREVQTFTLDLLIAGIENSSITVGFTLYLLARNLEVQKMLHKELDGVLSSSDKAITAEVLLQLPLLRASVNEAMRMMCAVEGTARVLNHDISLSGYRVPAGANLLLMTQVASLLPVNFPDADQFRPERWMEKNKPHSYAHLPFGHGPRSCIGRAIALQKIHVLLVKLLQQFQIEYHHDDISRISRLGNMPDKPLRFTFVNRK